MKNSCVLRLMILSVAIIASQQTAYASQLMAGVRGLGERVLAPLRAGYGYTEEEKAEARVIIAELKKQLKQIAKKYEIRMQAVSYKASIQATNEWNKIRQKFENKIYQQQLITGDVMSVKRKLFWAAVATAIAVAGIVFLTPGQTLSKIDDQEFSEKPDQPVSDMSSKPIEDVSSVTTENVEMPTQHISAELTDATDAAEQVNTTNEISALPADDALMMQSASNTEDADAADTQEEVLKMPTEEPSVPVEEPIVQQGEQSEAISNVVTEEVDHVVVKDAAGAAADVETADEALLNKQLEWQENLWTHRDITDAAFETFVKEHTPPADVQKIIEDNKVKLADYNYLHLKEDDGSVKIFAKGEDVNRIFNTDVLRHSIEDSGPTSLEVPKKWIYKVDGNWRVFAEYINGEPVSQRAPLDLKETQDLVSFVEKTGYGDFFGDNIIRDVRNGKLAVIDIEDNSFRQGSRRQLVGNLLNYMSDVMDDDALKWSQDYYNSLENNPEGEALAGYLPLSGQWINDYYDYVQKNPEKEYLPVSDLEKVSHEFRKHRAKNRAKKR